MTDAFRRMMEEQERLRRILDPLADMRKHLGVVETARAIFDQHREREKLLATLGSASMLPNTIANIEETRKLVEGPAREAQRIGLLGPGSDLQNTISAMVEAAEARNRAFRLPAGIELQGLARQALASSELARSAFNPNTLQEAMARLETPWLSIAEAQRSSIALADVLAIGRDVQSLQPFAERLTSALRPKLGDWRESVSIPEEVILDPVLRSGLYREFGFDPALTDFSVAAFEQTVRIAGLDEEVDAEPEDDGFKRADEAFARLRRFEIRVRRFIDQVMRAEFGDDWMKHQLPTGMLDRWQEKRRIALDTGEEEQPIIDYADFTDYRPIIERKGNWARVFKAIFRRPDDVRESFQRLFPVRIATMHARIVTLDDELLLLVETKRILRAIGRVS
jgi:hypothetical protein